MGVLAASMGHKAAGGILTGQRARFKAEDVPAHSITHVLGGAACNALLRVSSMRHSNAAESMITSLPDMTAAEAHK